MTAAKRRPAKAAAKPAGPRLAAVASENAPPPHPTPKRGTKSLATRVAELERELDTFKAVLVDMAQVLEGYMEQQAIAASLPGIEQQLRSQVRTQIAETGLVARINGNVAATQ